MLFKVVAIGLIVFAIVCLIVFLLDLWKRTRILRLLSLPEPTDDELGQALSQMPFRENACYLPGFMIQRWTSGRIITVTKREDRRTTVIDLTKKGSAWQANGLYNGRADLVMELRGWCQNFIKLG
ncbi:MAG: hypothetical protein Greene041662_679 [Candidatus Peregrinibacteria bacterium Greene0416_62]|nr:MAG: hypothetical protein Greene041662_679 [Candidatus Peregrinibacteria bacterium Greene0416_62]TSC98328.1 MAG: hypothetical protein Greene101449_963 [Candidatus Peregrinibacteria bacterium Greene1014_49]